MRTRWLLSCLLPLFQSRRNRKNSEDPEPANITDLKGVWFVICELKSGGHHKGWGSGRVPLPPMDLVSKLFVRIRGINEIRVAPPLLPVRLEALTVQDFPPPDQSPPNASSMKGLESYGRGRKIPTNPLARKRRQNIPCPCRLQDRHSRIQNVRILIWRRIRNRGGPFLAGKQSTRGPWQIEDGLCKSFVPSIEDGDTANAQYWSNGWTISVTRTTRRLRNRGRTEI